MLWKRSLRSQNLPRMARWGALAPACPTTLACTARLSRVGALAVLHASVAIGPLLSGWLDARQLNANFFYAATVLLGAGQLLIIYDVATAALLLHAERTAHVCAARVQRAWRRSRARR